MKLIDKDALVAEIERLQESIKATAIDNRISKEQAEAYKVCVKIINFVEDTLEEIDDEQIRKQIIQSLRGDVLDIEETNKAIAWIEEQGQHKKFRDSIQVGDKVTRNRDSMLVNLSQLKRVAKPIDKVEPKFKVGDWVVIENIVYRIDNISRIYLILSTIDRTVPINYKYIQHNDNKIHLWTIKDAKEGDVLVSGINQPFIYNGKFTEDTVGAYCGIDINYDFVTKKYYSPENWDENWTGNNNIRPATKEQRNFLFRKMKEAGYEWNKEKKKLIKL